MTDSTCELAGKCSGCAWLGVPYREQLARKREAMAALLERFEAAPVEIEMHSVDEAGLRDRVDLSWRRASSGKLQLGLFDVSRELVLDIERCPQLSSALQAWLEVFRGNPPPFIEKGSARLRVAPDGERGVWLDLANLDVKKLLEQHDWLEWVAGLGHVEIGQRFKPLSFGREGLRLLAEPDPKPWSETYLGEALTPAPLYGVVGSFTQPGFRANRELVKTAMTLSRPLGKGLRALELFSGLGNFTLPLAALGWNVRSFEVDPFSAQCLERTLAEQTKLAPSIRFARQNLYSDKNLPELAGVDVLFVDPPRSGLKQVADHVENTAPGSRPRHVLYVSCFAESLAEDFQLLSISGYKLKRLVGVDQFPQSPHCEWVAWLEQA